jgi:hypothetical protein
MRRTADEIRRANEEWRPFTTLQGFVRLVLLVDWDPIGILGRSRAIDEYDGYVDEICQLILTDATREILVAHLDKIERQNMRMRGERRATTEVAKKLLGIYKAIQLDERMRPDT